MSEILSPSQLEATFDAQFLPIVDRLPHRRADYEAFASGLGQRDLDLLVLGTLYGQVGNGGFMRWVENGYRAEGEHDVRRALQRMSTAGFDTAAQVTSLLDDLSHLLAGDQPDEDEGKYSEALRNAVDDLDDLYFAFSDQFRAEVHRHFAGSVA